MNQPCLKSCLSFNFVNPVNVLLRRGRLLFRFSSAHDRHPFSVDSELALGILFLMKFAIIRRPAVTCTASRSILCALSRP
jgi:hypothetical protein